MPGLIALLTLVLAATMITNVSADAATALEKRRAVEAERTAARAYARRLDGDAARAQSRDPAGNYKDYPNWARAALGSSGSNSGR